MIDDFKEVSTKQVPTKKNDKSILTKIDFSKFNKNNWLKVKNNFTLNHIDRMGGAIWLNPSGELCYRFSDNGIITVNTVTKTNTVFSNFLDTDIKFINGTKEHQADVTATQIHLIHEDEFRPTKLEEFYEHKSLWYRNIFEPTKYLQVGETNYKEPVAILSLIRHLANYDDERMHYILNWLAYFFTGLKKSQVSLVLKGVQGAGKGILFKNIVKPLFGSKFCIQVNDKTLDTKFLGGIVEHKLFFNLDEISHNVAGNKSIKNFLKALVTNESITAEKKNINMNKETRIYGQVLITSNEPYVIEVETSDRRFSIFTTGDDLNNVSYLGYKNYEKFRKQINAELEDFSIYLKVFNVDVALANKALDTVEKRALVNATNDKFKLFVNAIEKKNIIFFEELNEKSSLLHSILIDDFTKDRISKPNIAKYFNMIFEDDVKSKGLMGRLRVVAPLLFDDSNMFSSNGKKFYRIYK